MKQTAVEWLINELGLDNHLMGSYEEELNKALEMEKEQIIDAFEQGEYTGRGFEDLTSEEYYNINFKPE
jgi:hypothetical protein